MLITSTASDMLPSLLGSSARFIALSNATPLHEVDTALHALSATINASGATPGPFGLGAPRDSPAMMSETCDPWPPVHVPGPPDGAGFGFGLAPQSIGSSSGVGGSAVVPASGPSNGHASPTKSQPSMTFAVGKSASLSLLSASFVFAP